MSQQRTIMVETKNKGFQPRQRNVVKLSGRPARWSHQQELDSLQGKLIDIVFTDRSKLTALLTNADQFAIQVAVGQSILTYFKHSLVSYTSTPDAPKV